MRPPPPDRPLRFPRLGLSAVAIAAMLVAIFATTVLLFRAELRREIHRKIVERDAAVLHPVALQHLADRAAGTTGRPASTPELVTAVLKSATQEGMLAIAVFDAHHDCVSRLEQSVQGVIITMAVDDIEAAYDNLYMEGLEIYKHMGVDVHGDRHFVVYDPNGILVNVIEGKYNVAKIAA